MTLPSELRCHEHQKQLTVAGSELKCENGCSVPIVKGIARFVDSANYASAFGLQWNSFRRTQLDSYTGTTISRDRLTRAVGGSLEVLRNKKVLEIGCGAGRFTELLLEFAGEVFACDLSSAVEANFANFGSCPNYFVCQADARNLPVTKNSFDFVVCLGVIQHTPSPEQTISALCGYLKPGGTLVIDHYAPDYPATFSRRWLRKILLLLPAKTAKSVALNLSRLLLPLHRLGWSNKRGRWRIRRWLRRVSPLVDYYEVYPQLGERRLAEWSLLDTHDTLTDRYKHVRSVEQIRNHLKDAGLVDLEVDYGGNGVEARGKLPLPPC